VCLFVSPPSNGHSEPDSEFAVGDAKIVRGAVDSSHKVGKVRLDPWSEEVVTEMSSS
jgi:hypothetical protein